MISAAQAKDWIDAKLGAAALDVELAAACEAVEQLEPAMQTAGYSDFIIQRLQFLAVALVTCTSARAIQSQGAPSGASRSFKNRDAALTEMRRELASRDTAGTLAALVGPDPVTSTLLLVV